MYCFYSYWLLNWFSMFAFESYMLVSSQQPIDWLKHNSVHICYNIYPYMLQRWKNSWANLRNCSERQETEDKWEKNLENKMINFDLRSPLSPTLSQIWEATWRKAPKQSVATPVHLGETCPPVADVGRMGLLGLVPHIDWLEMCLRLCRLIKEEQKQR